MTKDTAEELRVEQTEDHLWTLERKDGDGEWIGEKDFLSLQEACEAYHQSKLQALREDIRSCSIEVEDAIESQKDEGLPVPDWLKGQLHAFNHTLRLIDNIE